MYDSILIHCCYFSSFFSIFVAKNNNNNKTNSFEFLSLIFILPHINNNKFQKNGNPYKFAYISFCVYVSRRSYILDDYSFLLFCFIINVY